MLERVVHRRSAPSPVGSTPRQSEAPWRVLQAIPSSRRNERGLVRGEDPSRPPFEFQGESHTRGIASTLKEPRDSSQGEIAEGRGDFRNKSLSRLSRAFRTRAGQVSASLTTVRCIPSAPVASRPTPQSRSHCRERGRAYAVHRCCPRFPRCPPSSSLGACS